MAKMEKELFNFVNDPKYREKVINRLIKVKDTEYKKRIETIETDVDKLNKLRVKEIIRIANSRWEDLVGGKVKINLTEGKAIINHSEVFFSNIKGAELNMISGSRIITKETLKSKKHISLGGALAGGVINPIGAIAGGIGLGKKTSTGTSITNQIPTCTHLGVIVDIDGFKSEIVLLSSQVDKSNILFTRAESQAQKIISQLASLARTPVQSYLRPEEEISVGNIKSQIAIKQQELQEALADTPIHDIPDIYRTDEQIEMSSSEYLEYLRDTDELRASDKDANKLALNQELGERKKLEKQRKIALKAAEFERKEVEKQRMAPEKEDKRHNRDHNIEITKTIKRIRNSIIKVILWILSVFFILSSLVSFSTEGGVLSGIVFILTGSLINPLVTKWISEKFLVLPKWGIAFILMFGFFVGALTFPTLN